MAPHGPEYAIYSLFGTAQLNGLNVEAYLRHVLERLPDHPINRVDELLPWAIAAGSEPDQAVKEAETVKDLLKAVGKFLTLADKVIDAIKIVWAVTPPLAWLRSRSFACCESGFYA